jgi:hypothetical protein
MAWFDSGSVEKVSHSLPERQAVSPLNLADGPNKRQARTPLRWVVYLTAIGIATVGWVAFLSYCALALLGY